MTTTPEPGTEVTATVRGTVIVGPFGRMCLLRDGSDTLIPLDTLTDITPIPTLPRPHFPHGARGHCAECGLHAADPVHLRPNGRNNGRDFALTTTQRTLINARRATLGMELTE